MSGYGFCILVFWGVAMLQAVQGSWAQGSGFWAWGVRMLKADRGVFGIRFWVYGLLSTGFGGACCRTVMLQAVNGLAAGKTYLQACGSESRDMRETAAAART